MSFPIHPAAAQFPLLPADELAALEADIAANGLRDAITLDTRGRLIDGRNRAYCCARLGLEPSAETFAGDEAAIIALIWSRNAHRRHLSKQQLTMVAAFIHPEPETGGRGKKAYVTYGFPGLHQSALSQARLVLKHRPDLAAAIRDGEGSLEKAYAAVMAERTAGGDGGDGVPAKAYRQPKRKYPQALEDAAAAMVLDQGKTTAEAGAAAGVSAQVVIKSVAREQGRREAEAEIDPASLSISAQQKLATAIRQKERKLELDFEQRVQAEAQRRMREISLPHHLEALADAKRIMTTHKGIMPRAQFRKILACLHPDSQPSEAEKGEAFHFFKLHERALVAAAELPPPDDFPTTVEELLARRKKPLKPQPATTTP